MKKTKFLLILIGLLVWVSLPADTPAKDSSIEKSTRNRLHLVKRIYIGEIEGLFKDDPIKAFLKHELGNKGFTIVDNAASADAILTGDIEVVIILDGDGTDPPPDTLRFRLTTSENESLWETKLKVVSRSNMEKTAQLRARAIAERLTKDQKRSAKKAGL